MITGSPLQAIGRMIAVTIPLKIAQITDGVIAKTLSARIVLRMYVPVGLMTIDLSIQHHLAIGKGDHVPAKQLKGHELFSHCPHSNTNRETLGLRC